VPTPQSPQLARRAIASIEQQTHPNWEIVVLDHGPMPIGEWLRSLPVWERIRYARTPLSLPPGRARNDAMRLACGEYLAFLDEDNTFAPTHLETLVGAIEATGASIAATSTRCFLETANEQLTAFTTDGEIRVHRTPDDPAELSLIAAALPLNAVMLYRHMLDRAGTFDPSMWILEDYEYLVRLEALAPIAFSSALTLELHVGLRLTNALGAFLPRYVESLDAVYAATAVSPEIAEARARHRGAVQGAIAGVGAAPAGRDRVAQLIATLCGRAVIPVQRP
jgi:O-antigen biosynthesis protein